MIKSVTVRVLEVNVGGALVWESAGLSRRILVFIGIAMILVSAAMVLTSVHSAVDSAKSARFEPTPPNQTLHLTIPEMARVRNVPVRTAGPHDSAALNAGVVHQRGTGFPWQKVSNTYLIGHRLGYPHTGSFLVFYDLNKLRRGDAVILKDAGGHRYVYRVFRRMIVGPRDTQVTRPVPGENVVSLQSCTLPNYSHRLIVQAKLVRVQRTAGRPDGGSKVAAGADRGFLRDSYLGSRT